MASLIVAASPVKVAAVNFDNVGLDPKKVEFYGEHFADKLGDRGLKVTTQKQIAAVLGLERQKQMLACNDDQSSSCVAELANALGVDGIVIGSLAKVGESIQLNVKIVNATDGARVASYSERVPTEEALIDALNRAARRLASQTRTALRGEPPDATDEVVAEARPGVPMKALIPAAVGVALLGTGVALGLQSESRYQQLTGTEGVADSAAVRDSGRQLQTFANISFAAGAVALGVGAAMFFMDRPAQPVAMVSPEGVTVGVSGVLP